MVVVYSHKQPRSKFFLWLRIKKINSISVIQKWKILKKETTVLDKLCNQAHLAHPVDNFDMRFRIGIRTAPGLHFIAARPTENRRKNDSMIPTRMSMECHDISEYCDGYRSKSVSREFSEPLAWLFFLTD